MAKTISSRPRNPGSKGKKKAHSIGGSAPKGGQNNTCCGNTVIHVDPHVKHKMCSVEKSFDYLLNTARELPDAEYKKRILYLIGQTARIDTTTLRIGRADSRIRSQYLALVPSKDLRPEQLTVLPYLPAILLPGTHPPSVRLPDSLPLGFPLPVP